MGLAAGALDRRIALQQKTTSPNDLGEPVESWITIATVSAAKLNLSGTEHTRAAETAGMQPLRFQFRWSPELRDLDDTWRILYGDTIDNPSDWTPYNIENVNEIGRHEGFDIRCVSRGDVGA